MLAFALLPLFALTAAAIKVTAPTNTTGWTTSGPQTIKWESVSSDPGNFTIQLISPSNPNAPTTLAKEVSTADGTYTYTPESALAAGDQWRVNIISSTNQAGILAQSDYFKVEQGDAASASASASASAIASASGVGASVSKISASASATLNSLTPSGSGSAIPAASSSGAADRTVAGMSGLGLVVISLMGYFA